LALSGAFTVLLSLLTVLCRNGRAKRLLESLRGLAQRRFGLLPLLFGLSTNRIQLVLELRPSGRRLTMQLRQLPSPVVSRVLKDRLGRGLGLLQLRLSRLACLFDGILLLLPSRGKGLLRSRRQLGR